MTANDLGHINNLDENQRTALKECWLELIAAINHETSLSEENIINSDYGNELFAWIGSDNPDVPLLQRLRANKWDVKTTVEKIIDLLSWRRKWGVQEFLAKGENEISLEEAILGKGYFMGYDKDGRPICYIHAKEHIRGQFSLETTEKLAVLALETCRKLFRSPVETLTVVVDIGGLSMKNIDLQLPSFFINLVQSYYPETLGLGLIVNGSWLFNSCWSIIMPWLDPAVKSKVKFIKNEKDLTTYIDPSDIPQRLQGKHSDFKYILPTDEDQAMLDAFRSDHQGKTIAETNHQQAAINYLQVTERWARSEDNQTLVAERSEASKNLMDTYEKLLPYVTTRIHYHRTKEINEPIFDITYKKLSVMADEDVICF